MFIYISKNVYLYTAFSALNCADGSSAHSIFFLTKYLTQAITFSYTALALAMYAPVEEKTVQPGTEWLPWAVLCVRGPHMGIPGSHTDSIRHIWIPSGFFLSHLLSSYIIPKRLKLTTGAFELFSTFPFKKKWWEIHILSISWHLILIFFFWAALRSQINIVVLVLSAMKTWEENTLPLPEFRDEGGPISKHEWVHIFQNTNNNCPSRTQENCSTLRLTWIFYSKSSWCYPNITDHVSDKDKATELTVI